MNVSLPPELEDLVHQKVQSGVYPSPSEVIGAGLRLLKEQDALRQIRTEELHKEISVGIEQADRGEVASLDVEAVKTEGRRGLRKTATFGSAKGAIWMSDDFDAPLPDFDDY